MIQLNTFAGEIPKLIGQLLPDGYAQTAKNCKLTNGGIMPYRQPSLLRQTAPATVTFYKSGDTWFEWPVLVDVQPAPIATDRLYVTGDGVPKIVIDTATVYPLAVPMPAAALVASVDATVPDPTTQTSILYAYTYVTAFDEESEPSTLSNEVLRSPGMNVTLTGFLAPPTTRNVNRIRIYRSQTSATGATDLYFIIELPIPVPASYADNVEALAAQEAIPSTYYNPPPDGLSGIISLPNGIMAGFVGKDIYFCEPWLPHAWPQKYALTTNFNIVALGVFGHSIAVLTTGNPYVITGVTPDVMTMERIEVNFPCINKRGVVDLGYSVVYPAPDGLVSISGSGAQLVSRSLISRDDWRKMSPATFISSQYDGRYLAAYDYTDSLAVEQKGILVIDLTGDQPFISRLDALADYMFYEIGAGTLYMKSGINVDEFDALGQPFMTMTWRSKVFMHTGGVNYGAVRIDAEDISGVIGGSGSISATVYADGAAIRTITVPNEPQRLPSGFLARKWEIEFSGTYQVNSAAIAWTPGEFAVMGQGGVQ